MNEVTWRFYQVDHLTKFKPLFFFLSKYLVSPLAWVRGPYKALELSNTCNFYFYTWFPHRLESEDHARPRFCPTLVIFIFYTWFPHRLESEDHARPWLCPWALVLNQAWAANLLGPKIRGYFRSLRSRGTFWASQCSKCAFSRLLYPQSCRRRWKSSQRHFVHSVPWDAAWIKCHHFIF